MPAKAIRIALCDDHPMIREGLEHVLRGDDRFFLVHSCATGEELIEAVGRLPVEVVILDFQLPGKSGIQVCEQLSASAIALIGYSMISDTHLIARFLRAGGRGFVSKQSPSSDISKAIEGMLNGHIWLDPTVAKEVTHAMQQEEEKPSKPRISLREKEVLSCILRELTTSEIASELHITVDTVETHRRNLLQKLGAKNLAGLVRIAIEERLLD